MPLITIRYNRLESVISSLGTLTSALSNTCELWNYSFLEGKKSFLLVIESHAGRYDLTKLCLSLTLAKTGQAYL